MWRVQPKYYNTQENLLNIQSVHIQYQITAETQTNQSELIPTYDQFPSSECHVQQMRHKECKTHVEECEAVLRGLDQGTKGLSTAVLQLADMCERLSRTS